VGCNASKEKKQNNKRGHISVQLTIYFLTQQAGEQKILDSAVPEIP
jgi:hypothetical protein